MFEIFPNHSNNLKKVAGLYLKISSYDLNILSFSNLESIFPKSRNLFLTAFLIIKKKVVNAVKISLKTR